MNHESEKKHSLYLMIGNSRLHWAWFQGDNLKEIWHQKHLIEPQKKEQVPSILLPDNLLKDSADKLSLYIASVVPSQTLLWQKYPQSKIIELAQIPLEGIYPTLGIDRALAILGAGEKYGFPCLVIDVGTALTITGAGANRQLIGGAILPGLQLQFQSLSTKTAALPALKLPKKLPPRWALNTPDAIASGILYTILAGIGTYIINWQASFANSPIIFTGGDTDLLQQYFQVEYPEIAPQVIGDHELIFWGMKAATNNQLKSNFQ